MLQTILPAYGLKEESLAVEAFGSGLINHTWKITTPEAAYILQKVNHNVFENPANIAHNIKQIAMYLKQHDPNYLFVAPLLSGNGEEMVYKKDEGFFRMFPFVPRSHSIDVVETPEQAFEAAVQFGRFTRLLGGLNVNRLKITVPHFHDLSLRYQQFVAALKQGNKERVQESEALIKKVMLHADIVAEYKDICVNKKIKQRVTHHDTKISNVLFDENGTGICVIDLDTVMPGFFISDIGDMMRTYLSPANEEERDFTKIAVRDLFYKAIVRGYLTEMNDELIETEKRYVFYSGKFMIYMQALRFLTDYINDDVYYGAKYSRHNLVRAGNQLTLLQRLLEKEPTLQRL
ncbi:MAG: aminoglycoside phosphotransferase family protein [Chitinophagaceae bacterium]